MTESNFTKIPNKLISAPNIDHYDLSIFCTINMFNPKYPGMRRLCTMLKVSPTVVIRTVKKLKKLNIISVEKRKGLSNIYTINNERVWSIPLPNQKHLSTPQECEPLPNQKHTTTYIETEPLPNQKRNKTKEKRLSNKTKDDHESRRKSNDKKYTKVTNGDSGSIPIEEVNKELSNILKGCF